MNAEFVLIILICCKHKIFRYEERYNPTMDCSKFIRKLGQITI